MRTLHCLLVGALSLLIGDISSAAGVYQPASSDLRIGCWNVFNSRIYKGNDNSSPSSRYDAWPRILNGVQADIWMLQEMFYTDSGVPDSYIEDFTAHVRSVTGEDSWAWASDNKGRVTLSRYPIQWSGQVSHRIHASWINLPASVSSKDLLVINVHFMQLGQSVTARDFVRQVRAGNHSAGIPSDISIVFAGDFNALYRSTRYDNIRNEGFTDVYPTHNGTHEKNTIGGVNMSNGTYLSPIGGHQIDFALLSSTVFTTVHSFILNTIIMPETDRDAFGFEQRDITVDANRTDHDFVNGHPDCDHFPIIFDLSRLPLKPNDAAFVSQSVPAWMAPGETNQVTVQMKNTGADTWTAANAQTLGSQPAGSNTWGVGRVYLAGHDSIAPGESKTFIFEITAPDTPGAYSFQCRMVDDEEPNQGWFGPMTPAVRITVSDLNPASVLLAVDLHQNASDPLPAAPDYFAAWQLGNLSAGNPAPSTVINGYTVTFATGDSIASLSDPVLQAGFNARNRANHIPNSATFTHAELMRERIASLGNPTDPASGNGTGQGIYLKIEGLTPNTPYRIQAWGVDFREDGSLKNGYNYGFDATAEIADYTSLPELGSYSISGNPTTITDNDQYSVVGLITTDADGALVYKQISDIDRSVMNGFTLSSVTEGGKSGYEQWAIDNNIQGSPSDMHSDGMSNLVKYALDEHPVLVRSGEQFQYRHKQRKDDPSLEYVVQTTSNLQDSESWVDLDNSPDIEVFEGAFDQVIHTIPPSDDPSVFIRLKIICT